MQNNEVIMTFIENLVDSWSRMPHNIVQRVGGIQAHPNDGLLIGISQKPSPQHQGQRTHDPAVCVCSM
mgnify:CR=1 FL=1